MLPVYAVPNEPRYEWVQSLEPGHSITALEMYHGVLRSSIAATHAFFYFRDPQFTQTVPEDERERYRPESREGAVRLQRLKTEIKNHCEVKYYLNVDETFGGMVLEDLWASVQGAFPEPVTSRDELSVERSYQDTFIEDRSKRFIGRHDLLTRMTEYANGLEPGPLVITGEPGCGKSSLLANFSRQHAIDHKDAFVLAHFIGVSPGSADIRQSLRRICSELTKSFRLTEVLPTDFESLRIAFGKILAAVARLNAGVVLIIDALDQLDETHRAHTLDWLPNPWPTEVRLILSTLPGRCLESLRCRGIELNEISIGQLPENDCTEIISQTLWDSRKKLNDVQMRLLLSKKESLNPLYLTVACEELRVLGDFKSVDKHIGGFANDLPGLFEQVLERLEHDHGEELIRNSFSLVACSHDGLLETEILELLKPDDDERLPPILWARIYRSVRLYLTPAGENSQQLVNFYHTEFRKAVVRRYLSRAYEQQQRHRQLLHYFESKDDPDHTGSWRRLSARAARVIVDHAIQTTDAGIVTTLARSEFLNQKKAEFGEAECLSDARQLAEFFAGVGLDHEDTLFHCATQYAELVDRLRSKVYQLEAAIREGDRLRIDLILSSLRDRITRAEVSRAAAELLDEVGRSKEAQDLLASSKQLIGKPFPAASADGFDDESLRSSQSGSFSDREPTASQPPRSGDELKTNVPFRFVLFALSAKKSLPGVALAMAFPCLLLIVLFWQAATEASRHTSGHFLRDFSAASKSASFHDLLVSLSSGWFLLVLFLLAVCTVLSGSAVPLLRRSRKGLNRAFNDLIGEGSLAAGDKRIRIACRLLCLEDLIANEGSSALLGENRQWLRTYARRGYPADVNAYEYITPLAQFVGNTFQLDIPFKARCRLLALASRGSDQFIEQLGSILYASADSRLPDLFKHVGLTSWRLDPIGFSELYVQSLRNSCDAEMLANLAVSSKFLTQYVPRTVVARSSLFQALSPDSWRAQGFRGYIRWKYVRSKMLPLANGIWRGTVEAATPEACAFSVVLLPIRLFSPVTGFLVIGSLFALMIPGLLLGVLASFGRDTWALANLLVRFPDLTLEELHSEINAILERHLLGTADIFHLFLLRKVVSAHRILGIDTSVPAGDALLPVSSLAKILRRLGRLRLLDRRNELVLRFMSERMLLEALKLVRPTFGNEESARQLTVPECVRELGRCLPIRSRTIELVAFFSISVTGQVVAFAAASWTSKTNNIDLLGLTLWAAGMAVCFSVLRHATTARGPDEEVAGTGILAALVAIAVTFGTIGTFFLLMPKRYQDSLDAIYLLGAITVFFNALARHIVAYWRGVDLYPSAKELWAKRALYVAIIAGLAVGLGLGLAKLL